MEKNIYNLGLHELIEVPKFGCVIRVPGGWIYTRQEPQVNIANPVFIPFNDEFQDKQQTLKELFPPEEKEKFSFKKSLVEMGVEPTVASDWLKVRAKKKAANTETAFNGIKKQIQITTAKPNDCIKLAVEKSWSGFKAEWYFNEQGKPKDDEGRIDIW